MIVSVMFVVKTNKFCRKQFWHKLQLEYKMLRYSKCRGKCLHHGAFHVCRTKTSSPGIWSMAHNYMATLHNAVPYKKQLQKRWYFYATQCNACKYTSLCPPQNELCCTKCFFWNELALQEKVSIWCGCHSETCTSLHLHLNSLRCSFTQLHSKVCWT